MAILVTICSRMLPSNRRCNNTQDIQLTHPIHCVYRAQGGKIVLAGDAERFGLGVRYRWRTLSSWRMWGFCNAPAFMER